MTPPIRRLLLKLAELDHRDASSEVAALVDAEARRRNLK